MSGFGNDKYTTPEGQLRREAEAERERAKFVAESQNRVGPRCPECGNLGSLEEIDGVLKCVDCDETIARTRSLGGLGRK